MAARYPGPLPDVNPDASLSHVVVHWTYLMCRTCRWSGGSIGRGESAKNQQPRPRDPFQGSLVVSQSVSPRQQEMELRSGSEQLHNPLFTTNRVQFNFPGTQAHLATGKYNNRAYTKFEYTPAGRVDACFLVKDMRVIRRASRPVYRGSRTKSPPPVRIDAARCENDITASWRDDGAPVVHHQPCIVGV